MIFNDTQSPSVGKEKTIEQKKIETCIALGIVWFFSVGLTFILCGVEYGINSIINMFVSILATNLTDIVTVLIKHKKGGNLLKEIKNQLRFNYSYVCAMVLVLTLPAWTPFYVVIIGAVIATGLVKNLFGGFGKNLVNPVAASRIILAILFGNVLSYKSSGILSINNGTLLDLVESTNWVPSLFPLPEGYNVVNLLFGTYIGTLGGTCTLLLVFLGIGQIIRKNINWRTPSFYLGTIILSALTIALVLDIKQPLSYTLTHLSLGGIIFSSIFTLTECSNEPKSNFSKALIGITAGLITMVIRMNSLFSFTDATAIAIVGANLLAPLIEKLYQNKIKDKNKIKYIVVFSSLAITMATSTLVGYISNGGRNIYEINGKHLKEFEKSDYKSLKSYIGIDLDKFYFIEREDQDMPVSYGDVEFYANTEKGYDSSYAIYSSKNKLIGYVYNINLLNQQYASLDSETNQTVMIDNPCQAWIAVDLSKGQPTIIGANCLRAPGATNVAAYNTLIINGLNGVSSSDQIDGLIGTTYSYNSIKLLVSAALTQGAEELK